MSTTATAFATLAERLGWQTQIYNDGSNLPLVTIRRDDQYIDTIWDGDTLLIVQANSLVVKDNRLAWLFNALAR